MYCKYCTRKLLVRIVSAGGRGLRRVDRERARQHVQQGSCGAGPRLGHGVLALLVGPDGQVRPARRLRLHPQPHWPAEALLRGPLDGHHDGLRGLLEVPGPRGTRQSVRRARARRQG